MDGYCAFVEDEEDNLPEKFDQKFVKLQNTDNCQLCDKAVTRMNITGQGHKRHHCRKCGMSVCSLCSQQQRRLCKEDKQKYRVCDQCDTLMSNANFEQMYKDLMKQQQTALIEIKKAINKKDKQVKSVGQ